MNMNSIIIYPNDDVLWKILKLNWNIWWPLDSFEILKILSADKCVHNWIAEIFHLRWSSEDARASFKMLHRLYCIDYYARNENLVLLRKIIENIITKDCKQSVQITAFIPPDIVYITADMDSVVKLIQRFMDSLLNPFLRYWVVKVTPSLEYW